MKFFLPELFELVEYAREGLNCGLPDQQIVCVLSSKGNRYRFINDGIKFGNTSDEEAFIKMLTDVGDTQLKCLVCMWSDGTVDIPSGNFRKLLCQADCTNLKTFVAVNSKNDITCKAISDIDFGL